MKITIKYFAAMREAVGKSKEIINTTAKTPSELLQQLKQRYIIDFKESDLKVALNEEYTLFSSPLTERDTVVFIPPVAGG